MIRMQIHDNFSTCLL